ncbi:glycosyltransferase family 4 protein [Parvularcula oceani]|uniref:glycosyltransferase family 4 protein n=1 Tax=Parvularcula oceani TaxID=1247963 RepID=UPI00138E1200|nr:glycosyltransferase family 4 protein [Parvularcula oceani]
MSEIAREVAVRRARQFGRGDVANKIQVFRGGISQYPPAEDRPQQGQFRFLIVGNHLFHKGIQGVVRAVERLRARGANIHLDVVGGFRRNRMYAAPGFVPNPDEQIAQFSESDWITFHGKIPNHQVKFLMAQSHLFLHPSIDESLGWVVVEAGLQGLPRLALDVFATRELIRNRVDGWTIPIDVNDSRRWSSLGRAGPEEWDDLQSFIAEEICNSIEPCLDHGELSKMGARAATQMSKLYGIDQASKKLEAIYSTAAH